MMKKKMKKKEEIWQNNQDKITDNKETNKEQEDTGKENDGVPVSADSKSSTPENGSGPGSTSDNSFLEVKAVEEKLAEMQDKYIRLSAEFDNYRKRTLREKMELSKYAGENLLLNILPIMDDFERAIKHMDPSTDYAALKNGIDLIYGKFSEFLKQNGVKKIESLNCNFSVDLHEAVAKVQVTEEDKKGKVIDELLKGYYLNDKVLRFSKVVVGE
jgi:molecular chaperone GrpE